MAEENEDKIPSPIFLKTFSSESSPSSNYLISQLFLAHQSASILYVTPIRSSGFFSVTDDSDPKLRSVDGLLEKLHTKAYTKSLSQLENVIRFWRRSGDNNIYKIFMPALLNFQWGPCFITGSSVLPSKTGGYDVVKSTCLWICLNESGSVLQTAKQLGIASLSNTPQSSPGGLSFSGSTNGVLKGGESATIELVQNM